MRRWRSRTPAEAPGGNEAGMDDPLSEAALWAAGLAARLRRAEDPPAQGSSGAQPPPPGQALHSALERVPPERRQSFLQALAREMPSLDLASESAAAMALATRPARGGAWVSGLQGPPAPAGGRAGELCALLAEQLYNLESNTWGVWRQLAPQSEIKLSHDTRQMAAACLAGQPGVALTDIQRALDKSVVLLNTLFLAMQSGLNSFAVNYWQRFSPAGLHASVRSEIGGSLWRRLHALSSVGWLALASWRKYEALWQDFSAQRVGAEVQDTIVNVAEQLMAKGGLAAPASAPAEAPGSAGAVAAAQN